MGEEDEVYPVSFRFGCHSRLYHDIGGGEKVDGVEGLERVNEGFPPCGSWFLLKEAVETATSIGVYFIGVAKTNTKIFFKAVIEGLEKD